MRSLSAAFSFGLALAACAPSEAPSDASAANTLALSGVRHDTFRDGHPLVQARVDTLVFDRTSGRVEATGVRLSDGAAQGATLAAPRAEGSTKASEASLSGGVVLTGSAGEKLETASCALDLARDTATGRKPVTLATPDLSARADGSPRRSDTRPGSSSRAACTRRRR